MAQIYHPILEIKYKISALISALDEGSARPHAGPVP